KVDQLTHQFSDRLAQRLAARDDHKARGLAVRWRCAAHGAHDLRHAVAVAVRVLGVTQWTLEVAAREPEEHGGAAREGAFTLDGVEDAVDGQRVTGAGDRLLRGLHVAHYLTSR